MVGKVGDSQNIVNLPVTNIARVIVSNAKKLGRNHLHFSYTGASGGPPDVACIIQHGAD